MQYQTPDLAHDKADVGASALVMLRTNGGAPTLALSCRDWHSYTKNNSRLQFCCPFAWLLNMYATHGQLIEAPHPTRPEPSQGERDSLMGAVDLPRE
eukprot:4731808-Amphidinium_carterae.1